jgi:hypothetical protein
MAPIKALRATRRPREPSAPPDLDSRGPAPLPFGCERPDGSPHGTEESQTNERAEIEGVAVSTEHWIGGERSGSSETFEDVSPIDEVVIARVARGGSAEVEAAVEAARAGFERWGATPAGERAAALHRVAKPR